MKNLLLLLIASELSYGQEDKKFSRIVIKVHQIVLFHPNATQYQNIVYLDVGSTLVCTTNGLDWWQTTLDQAG